MVEETGAKKRNHKKKKNGHKIKENTRVSNFHLLFGIVVGATENNPCPVALAAYTCFPLSLCLTHSSYYATTFSTIIKVLHKGRRRIYDCTFHIRFRIRLSTRTHTHTFKYSHSHTYTHARTQTSAVCRSFVGRRANRSRAAAEAISLYICFTTFAPHTHTHPHTQPYISLLCGWGRGITYIRMRRHVRHT